MTDFQLKVNGKQEQLKDLAADTPLLWVLRDHLNLLGTKFGCGGGFCGACTVHVDGMAMRSCSIPVSALEGKAVTTIEGLAEGDELHPLQDAWVALDVPQCGYCQAGQIMNAAALLAKNPKPDDQEIDAAMAGNLCRCGCYNRIKSAISLAATGKIDKSKLVRFEGQEDQLSLGGVTIVEPSQGASI